MDLAGRDIVSLREAAFLLKNLKFEGTRYYLVPERRTEGRVVLQRRNKMNFVSPCGYVAAIAKGNGQLL